MARDGVSGLFLLGCSATLKKSISQEQLQTERVKWDSTDPSHLLSAPYRDLLKKTASIWLPLSLFSFLNSFHYIALRPGRVYFLEGKLEITISQPFYKLIQKINL